MEAYILARHPAGANAEPNYKDVAAGRVVGPERAGTEI